MTDYTTAFSSHIQPSGRYDITYNMDETDTIPSILVIDSKFRDSKSTQPNNYTVTLQTIYPDVISVELVYCDIPTGGYNIITGINDTILFTIGGADLVATVPAGLYALDPVAGGINDIRSAVQTALNAATANANYFSLPTVLNGVLQFQAPLGSFTFKFDGGLTSQRRLYTPRSMGRLLGFRPDTYVSNPVNQVNQVSATYPPILEMDSFITLHIDSMFRCDSTNSSIQNCFCILPMDSKNTNFNLLQDGNNIDNEEYVYYYKQPRKLTKLHISFLDMKGNFYNFNGQEHVLIFKIHTKTHKKKYTVSQH